MNIAILCTGFEKENLRLQPWRYILEMSKHLCEKGDNVHIVSKKCGSQKGEYNIDGIAVTYVNKFIKEELGQFFVNKSIEFVVFSFTPNSIVYNRLFKSIGIPKIAIITTPIYKFSEIWKSVLILPFYQIRNHLLYSIMPKVLYMKTLKNVFGKVVVMRKKNEEIFKKAGVNAKLIRIGKEISEEKEPIQRQDTRQRYNRILYLGSPYKIRGIYLLIDAVLELAQEGQDIELTILSRGEDKILSAYREKIERCRNICLVEGFLPKEEVIRHIQANDIIAMPFLIVPSDAPIGVIEALSNYKPVIATNLDGIPEMISGRGEIVSPGNVQFFKNAILSCAKKRNYELYLSNIHKYIEDYPTWEQSASDFENFIKQK